MGGEYSDGDMGWIHVAFVNTVMNLRVPQKAGKSDYLGDYYLF
jgi:hypothetical protein